MNPSKNQFSSEAGMKPKEVVGGTQSTWEDCQGLSRDKNLVPQTGGDSEKFEMVEVPQPPVQQEEQHIFILTKGVFQVALRVLSCKGQSLINCKAGQVYLLVSPTSVPVFLLAVILSFDLPSLPPIHAPHGPQVPLLSNRLVIMMSLFYDSKESVCVCVCVCRH